MLFLLFIYHVKYKKLNCIILFISLLQFLLFITIIVIMSSKIITDRQNALGKKYADTTMRIHVLKKDMWTGPRQKMSDKNYFATSISPITFAYREVEYSPALDKICDEIIVNVIDHRERNSKGKNKVTRMNVTYKDGMITVENDGPGIEVDIHPGLGKYIAEVISTMYLKGENLDKADNDITGGTNGLGMKLTNTYSAYFSLETYDAVTKKLYTQHSSENMSKIQPPIILSGKNIPAGKNTPHTSITFMPDYIALGYKDGFLGTQLEQDFLDVFKTRLILAKMYMRDLTVTFNNDEIILADLTSLPRRIFGNNISTFVTTVKDPSDNNLHWEVCAVPIKNDDKTMTHFTNVNGVCVRDGTHIKYLYDQIYEKLKTKIRGAIKDKIKITKALLYSHLILFINSKIPNSALAWSGQRKDECSIKMENIKPYTFVESFLNKISLAVKEAIIDNLMDDNNDTDWAVDNNNKKDKYEKYTPATDIKIKSKKANTRLLFPEGDSAETMVRTGIAKIGGFARNGICNLGGNIVNARKETDIIEKNGKQLKILKVKLKNNNLFKFLIQHTGLNINYDYNPDSPTYEQEMSELKYGCFVVCVDQDLDGIGKIFSLFVNIFHLFWKNLLMQGYIKRFATPIIRTFKNGSKKNFIDFFDDYEYKAWLLTDESKGNWTTKYYKGLAGHERPFVIHMYERFDENLFTYIPDEQTDELFEAYFGKDSDERKDLLSTEVLLPTVEQKALMFETKRISLSFHLNFDTKSQKLSNINQTLHDVVGGMNEVGRKIFCGSYDEFKNTNEEIKVAVLTASISKKVKYHHGEASLGKSVKQKAFVGIGGKQLPLFLPESSLGSRLKGGKDAGSDRYVYVQFNKELMNRIYPPTDNFNLKYVYDEGKYVEPVYYKPIVPMVILESICMPADGWKIQVNARDLKDVVACVKRMIMLSRNNIDADKMVINKLKPFIDPRFKGTVKQVGLDTYTIGVYETNQRNNTITITELPIGVWNDSFCNSLTKKIETKEKGKNKYITEFVDHSSDTDVNIIIKVTNAFWTHYEQFATPDFDGIQEFLLLRKKMDDDLNFVMPDGSVRMFSNYEDPVKIWFPIREKAYIERYNRDIQLLKLKIVRLINEVKYSKESKDLHIDTMKDVEQAEQLLDSLKFNRMNHRIFANLGLRTGDELRHDIMLNYKNDPKINFDYLLDIRDRDKVKTVITKKEQNILELKNELNHLKEISPHDIWIKELDELLIVYDKGLANNWGVEFDTNDNKSKTKSKTKSTKIVKKSK